MNHNGAESHREIWLLLQGSNGHLERWKAEIGNYLRGIVAFIGRSYKIRTMTSNNAAIQPNNLRRLTASMTYSDYYNAKDEEFHKDWDTVTTCDSEMMDPIDTIDVIFIHLQECSRESNQKLELNNTPVDISFAGTHMDNMDERIHKETRRATRRIG